MKKKIGLLIVSLCLILWFVNAQSITFDVQWDWEFWYGCLVPIDVYVDTQWQEVLATDLVLYSSMEYKDFEATEVFPYFFPPVKWDDWMIHIWWFSLDKENVVNGKEKVGTIYFQQNNKFVGDGTVKLYFLWEKNTTDSNLNTIWWIDVLRQVWDAYVKFTSDLPACEQDVVDNDLEQIDGYSDKSFDEALQETMNQIKKDHPSADDGIDDEWWIMNNGRLYLCIWIGVVWLIVVICAIYKILSNKKKNSQWND